MATNNSSENTLQEKLQGQVATSVKEALEKSTTILSNLHHLSTYLDVISNMASSADRVKNAHEQIQNIRADCASLLQTMYLGEIGLQSLQDMLKSSGGLSGLIPRIFSDQLSSTSVTTPSSSGNEHTDNLFDGDDIIGKHTTEHCLNDEPSPKKSVVAVFVCKGCNRKFALNSDPSQIPTHCRNCRFGIISAANDNTTLTDDHPKTTPIAKTVIDMSINPKKQLKPKSNRRGKFNQLLCKLCGISFSYRRCLLRHLREQHAQSVDVNNLHGYNQLIDIVQLSNVDSDTSKDISDTLSSSQSNTDIVHYGLHQTDISQHDLNQHDLDQHDLNQHDLNQHDLDQHDLSPSQHEVTESDFSQHELSQLELNNSELAQTKLSVNHHDTNGASSIIEAVQNQAMLDEASALLSQTTNLQTAQTSNDQSVTTSTSSLLSHMNSVAKTTLTPTTTQSSSKLEDDSSPFKEFRCTVCSKAFDRPYRLTRHLEIHDPNRPRIPCNYCSKTFTRKDSLESHIKTVHASVYPFTCTYEGCTRSFATRSMYLNHLKVHGDNKPYHCQECSESFTLLAELKDHFKKEHPENHSLRCIECFKVCTSMEELEEHKLHDHRFECESCGKIFARLAYLQVHVRVHNGQSKFNCRFCSDGFNSAYSYRQHMKNHPEYRRIVNVYPCHPCGKSFQEPKELVEHYETPEHRENAANMDSAVGPSTATSMMEGDLSVMGELMSHVVMNDSEEIINSIVNTHTGFEEISSSQS